MNLVERIMRYMFREAGSYQDLGDQIGSADSAAAIEHILRGSFLQPKAGTFEILRCADSVLENGEPVTFHLNGVPYSLEFQVRQGEEMGDYYYLDYIKCRTALVVTHAAYEVQKEEIPHLGLELLPGEIAKRHLLYAVHRESPDMCFVFGASATRKGFEGQGFSLGLGLLNNLVIENVMSKKVIPATTFRSEIQDRARAQDAKRSRKGWSSNLAYLLGHQWSDSSELFSRDFS